MKQERNRARGEKTRKRLLVERGGQTSKEERSASDFKQPFAVVSQGDAGGLCQGETDGLGK